MKIFTTLRYLLLVMVLGMGVKGFGQSTSKFNDGYLTIFKVTSGAALGSTGTAIITEEYVPTGASQSSPNFSVPLPTTTGSPNKRLVCAGTTASNGLLTRSENGRYLLIPGYDAAVGDANTTFNSNASIRTIDASGNIGAGIQGTLLTGNNGLRGPTSDDLSNYWVSGATTGIVTSTNGSSTTVVSTTQTNTRAINIFNGQLYYSTGSATVGIYKVGTGKPTSAGANVSTILFTLAATNTSPYSFSVSPDGNTVYVVDDGSSKGIFRYTNTAGTWSSGTLIFTGSSYTGLAVDWTGYAFNASSANGAKIYACNPTTLIGASDNGTSALSTTTLRSISGNNAFRGLSFSPIKQTVIKGANTPAAGNITQSASSAVLFQFNLAATEGYSTIKKVIINQSGTATIGSGNNISNFHLLNDANNDGIADPGEIAAPLATGIVAGSNITFSAISLGSYIAEGASKNLLVIGDVAAAATVGNTFIPSIVSDKSLNSVNYTTNLVNASGSWVTIGATAPTGNTLTIAATGASTPPTLVAAPGATVDANFNITYADDATWRGAVQTVQYGAATLTAGTDYSLSAGILTLKPTGGNAALHVAGTQTVTVTATGYTNATVSQPIGFGAATKLGIVTQPAAPAINGNALSTQPVVVVQDQYGNAVTTSTASITANVGAGTWTLGGTTSQNAVNGTGNATFTDLTATSAAAVTGATVDFTSSGLTHKESNGFNIPAPPTLYTWSGTGTTTWALATNWSPNGIPANGDAVQFTGSSATTVTNVPTVSLTSFAVAGTGAVTLQATGAISINVGGGSAPQFNVATNASLISDGTNAITINILSGNTGSVSGSIKLQAGAHRLTAASSNGLTFNSGGSFTAGDLTTTGYTGSSFGTTTANSVVFASGSTFFENEGSNPFALTQPSSVVVFQTGSLFKLNGNLIPSLSGRTYANFEFNHAVDAIAGSAAAALSIDNLTIDQGSFSLSLTGTPGHSIKGNISVASGATLVFAPSTTGTVNFNGGSAQSVTNSGTLTFGPTETVSVTNSNGVTLNSLITIAGNLTIATGANINANGNNLTVNGNFTNNSSYISGGATLIFAGTTGTQTWIDLDGQNYGSVQINNTGSGVQMNNNITVDALNMAAGILNINSHNLTINGTVTGSGTLTSSSTSNLVINGTAGTLNFTQTSAATRSVNNLTLNTGSSATLGNALDIYGVVGLTSASLDMNGQSITLKSNASGTARVGNLTGSTLTGATNVTVERFIAAIGRKWRFLSGRSTSTSQNIRASWQEGGAPVNNLGTWITAPGGTNGFDGSSNSSSLLKYVPAGPSWTSMTATNTGSINDEQGYMLFVRGDRNDLPSNGTNNATVLRTTGTLNQGTQTGISIDPLSPGYTIIGNPFASPIDFENMSGVPNLSQFFYIWDPTLTGSFGVGGYRLVERVGAGDYQATPSISPTDDQTLRYISSGQAFFAQATLGISSLVIDENSKAGAVSVVPTKINLAPDQQLIVNLMNLNPGNVESMADAMRLRFDDAYSRNTTDDITKMSNFAENIYSFREGKKLIVEQRPLISKTDTVFLRLTGVGIKNYRFKMNTQDFAQPGVTAFLQDAFLGSSTAIDLSGNTNTIDFSVTSNPSSAASDRFMIVFVKSAPPVSFNNIKAYQKANDIAVEWNVSYESTVQKYELERSTDGVNFAKKTEQAAKGNNSASVSYNWLDLNPAIGDNYYRVRVVGIDGSAWYSSTAKVTINKFSLAITVYPNPVTGKMISLQLSGMDKGVYSVRLVDNNGQVVFSGQFTHGGGSAMQSLSLGKGIPTGNYFLELTAPGNNKSVKALMVQ